MFSQCFISLPPSRYTRNNLAVPMSLLPHKVGPSSQCMMNGLHGRDSGDHFVTSRRMKTSASGSESNPCIATSRLKYCSIPQIQEYTYRILPRLRSPPLLSESSASRLILLQEYAHHAGSDAICQLSRKGLAVSCELVSSEDSQIARSNNCMLFLLFCIRDNLYMNIC